MHRVDTELISIIIPVYNVYQYLDRCVESVIRQTYTNIEIILVDDGSTDGSSEKCDEWAEKDCRIRVVHKRNGGLSDARNSGIDNSFGNYIGFVDADDYIEKNMYEELYNAIEREKSLLATSGMIEHLDNNAEIRYINFGTPMILTRTVPVTLHDFLSTKTDCGMSISCCCKLFSRTLFESDKFVVGQRSEDIDLLWRILRKGIRVTYINKAYYHYVHRNNSITTMGVNETSFDLIDISWKIVNDVEHEKGSVKCYAYENLVVSCVYIVNQFLPNDYSEYAMQYCEIRKRLSKKMLKILLCLNVDTYYKIVMIEIVFGIFARRHNGGMGKE